MKFTLKVFLIIFFVSCNNKISGVIVNDKEYNKKIELIIDGYENNDLSPLSQFLDDQITSTYSTNVFFGKKSLINTWNNDYYYFKDIELLNREIYTVYNKDLTFTTVLKSNWKAIGKFSGLEIKIHSYYEFVWKNDKIIIINTYFDNYPYYLEIKEYYNNTI